VFIRSKKLKIIVSFLSYTACRVRGALINTSSGDPLWQSLTLDSLLLRKGCAITLTQKDSLFTGATTGKACTSSLRGATYATSVVTIEANKLVSWDRGFNGKDEQVWGAEKGAYIFDRIK
jgi:hypothetical protein